MIAMGERLLRLLRHRLRMPPTNRIRDERLSGRGMKIHLMNGDDFDRPERVIKV